MDALRLVRSTSTGHVRALVLFPTRLLSLLPSLISYRGNYLRTVRHLPRIVASLPFVRKERPDSVGVPGVTTRGSGEIEVGRMLVRGAAALGGMERKYPWHVRLSHWRSAAFVAIGILGPNRPKWPGHLGVVVFTCTYREPNRPE